MSVRPLISFDWAIKKLLRQKSNYDVLEGFLSELLKKDIKILKIPKSETNSNDELDKINKVDILCKNENEELILIDLQCNNEYDYFHRMLFGASKIITDYISQGYSYDQISKVYSVSIVNFDLGQGEDYLYHGMTTFTGKDQQDTFKISGIQKELFKNSRVYKIFPEYYLIKVGKFQDLINEPLDEWIYYLKNNCLPGNYKAKGLEKLAKILNYDNMDLEAKAKYDAYLKDQAIKYGEVQSAR